MNDPTPLPQSEEAEISVLGSMIIESKCIPEVVKIIAANDFYHSAHQLLFNSLVEMNTNSQPIDLLTTKEYMSSQGTLKDAGGIGYITDVANGPPSALHAEYYAKIVRDKSVRRTLIQTHDKASKNAYLDTTDTEQLVDELEINLIKIKKSLSGRRRPVLDILNAEDIMEENIVWLWEKRLALGTINFITGDMDRGKSYVSLDLAARFSVGADMPDGTPGQPPGNVLIIAQEDSYKKAAIKRLRQQGADLTRIKVSRGVPTGEPGIFRMWRAVKDRKLLEHEILKHDIKLIIIDPLKAYLGGVKTNDETEVRDALEPYSVLADINDAVVLCVAHNNKGGSNNATHRQGGSIAFGAVARSVWTVEPNKEAQDEFIFMRTKNNWAAKADNPALFYYIDANGLHWTGQIKENYTAQDHIDQEYTTRNKESPKNNECQQWILGYLMGGESSGPNLEAEALEAGHSKVTFYRARAELKNKGDIIRTQGLTRSNLMWSLPTID